MILFILPPLIRNLVLGIKAIRDDWMLQIIREPKTMKGTKSMTIASKKYFETMILRSDAASKTDQHPDKIKIRIKLKKRLFTL